MKRKEMAFAEKLKELRKENNLTQKQFANLLNTTDDSVFSWEKGRSQPSLEIVQAICEQFSVSADYLLGLEND